MLKCKICSKVFSSRFSYANHIKFLHKLSDAFPCGFNCDRTFELFSSFRRHNLVCSRSFTGLNDSKICKQNLSNSSLKRPNSENYHIFDERPESSSECPSKDHANVNNLSASSALSFILKMYENNSVTRSVIQSITEDVSDLVSAVLQNIKTQLNPILETLPDEQKVLVKSVLSENPFELLNSEHKRFKFLEKQNYLIKSESYFIGEMFENRKNNLAVKRCEGEIVPIRRVLKLFLELPNVYSVIDDYITEESKSTYISSIFSGTLWKSIVQNEKYSKKILLPLLLYFDDYEPCNPLGTHAGIHKMGALYFSLPCIPPQFAKKLHNLFLFGLFYSADRNTYGNASTFKPFISELSFLENHGIDINLPNGKQIHIHFTVILIIGDNLGLNSIFGLNECFVANYFCRICRADKATTKKLIFEDDNLLRNKENYQQDLAKKCGGVKEYCVWNDLPNYHISENSSVDVMHDLLEGVCRYTIAKLLRLFILQKKCFTIDMLNNRIKYFDFCDTLDIGNRIPLINLSHIEKGVITISSAEMHALTANLPLLIGDLIDPEDDAWTCFLLLYKIMTVVFKPFSSEPELVYLKFIIAEFLTMYITVFNSELQPKFHFLLHYPRLIRRLGPLNNLSCIRFEAFHRIAKSYAHVAVNRVNLPYTLSMKHQLKLSHRFALKMGLHNSIEVGPVISFNSTNDNFSEVKWIRRNGITFKKDYTVIINFDNDFEPEFGVIKHVLFLNDDNIIIKFVKVSYSYYKSLASYLHLNTRVASLSDQCISLNICQTDVHTVATHKSGNGHTFINEMAVHLY